MIPNLMTKVYYWNFRFLRINFIFIFIIIIILENAPVMTLKKSDINLYFDQGVYLEYDIPTKVCPGHPG